MLKNYLNIALRTLLKHKGYAFINVAGLAIGLACCLLIGLYVFDELSYDRFPEKADRIYRVDEEITTGNTLRRWAYLSAPHAPALQAEIPEIEQAVRFFTRSFVLGNDRVTLDGIRIAYVDPAALEMFSFPVQEGVPATMLAEPGSIVLTAETRARLFGDAPALGQQVVQENRETLQVTGVIERPAASHFSFDALVPFSTVWDDYAWLDQWRASTTNTYVLLRQDTPGSALSAKLNAFLRQHHGEHAAGRKLYLHPLTDIHLRPATTGSTGTLGIIRLFIAIGGLVLLIACINYINLATAQAADRLKEVGMRKILGARRIDLIVQLLGESIALALGGFVMAVLLAEIALPFVNTLTQKDLSLSVIVRLPVLAAMTGAVVAVGVGAGLYPAIFLARFRPVLVLKRYGATSRGTPILRQGLVATQFLVSIVLIAATLLIQQQLSYLSTRNLGFSGEQVVSIVQQGADQDALRTLKQELLRLPQVVAAGRSSAQPGEIGWVMSITPADTVAEDAPTQLVDFMLADADYLPVMGMTLKAGRNFSADRETDAQNAIIINEATLRALGFRAPEEAVGRRFDVNQYQEAELVGVVEDFHYASLRQEIKPLVIAYDPDNTSFVAVKLASERLPETLAALESVWMQVLPDWPFVYSFVDDDFATLYRNEQRLGALIGAFTLFALLIACLGLFGLTAFTARQRTKEIGIRKVFGASVPNIVVLLSKDFLRLVLLASVVAIPLAFYAMNQWLEDFAYRVAISWWIFLLAGLTALSMALLTVSYQAIRTARANPVKALRYE